MLRRIVIATLLLTACTHPSFTADFHDDDPVVVSRITSAMEFLVKKFPELEDVTVSSQRLRDTRYAEEHGDTIVFNRWFTSDHKTLENTFANDVATHFHPPLGDCTAEEFLTFHEAGHVLDYHRDWALSKETGRRFSRAKGLSVYSYDGLRLNPLEAFAEGFAATLCHSAGPVEKEMYEMVEQ